MSFERFVRTDLPIDGACTFKLITQNNGDFGTSIELFNLLKSYPAGTMPQITVSRSARNVIRGMHCSPHHKLVGCPTGKAFDVVVDLRKSSPTYLKWSGAWLDKNTHIVIPPYCAHGFFAAEDDTSILYLQGGCFAAELDFSLAWDDPTVGINWPKPIEADDYIISPKDRNNPKIENVPVDKIQYRLEHYAEVMRLCPFADFAIISDSYDLALPIFEAVTKAGMTAHYCTGNGTLRDTLEGEFIALRPGKSVIHVVNVAHSMLDNYTEIMNVVAACYTRGFHLTIVLNSADFQGKEAILPLIQKEAKNVLVLEITKNTQFQSFASLLKTGEADVIVKKAAENATGILEIGH